MKVSLTPPDKATERRDPGRRFTRRIGSTNYEVAVYLSETSRETMDDKILRLIQNDASKGEAMGQ
jgi:hypothetical protein